MMKGLLILILGMFYCSSFLPNPASAHEIFDKHYLEARKKAFENGKPLLIYFVTDDCVKCEEQRKMIENDRELAKQLEGKYETAIVNVDDFDGRAIREIYQVENTPAYLLVTPAGEVTWRYYGHISKSDLVNLGRQGFAHTPAEGDASMDTRPSKVNQAKKYSIKKQSPETPLAVENKKEGAAENDKAQLPAYQIQFGFFGSKENAKNLKAKLHGEGHKDCYIQEENRDGKTFYRVLSPLFTTEGDAELVLKSLEQQGLEGTIRQIQ